MSTKDLVPLGRHGNEEHDRQVRSKLKGSGSDRRKMAQRIAGIKKSKPENVEAKLLALISDPKISALEIVKLIEEVKKMDIHPNTRIQLINSAIKAHSTIFGTKNFNLNMNITPQSSKSMQELYLEVISEQNKEVTNESNREGDTERSSNKEERTISD